MIGAGFALLCGLDGALILLGVWSPVLASRLSQWHGPLMTLGFIGTVICLERAAALDRPVGYLVLTILGERLELSRLTMARNRFLPVTALCLLAALMVQVASPRLGWPLLGAVLVVMSAWLVGHDVAPVGMRRGGQPAYIGGMLMVGYVWLAVAGLIWILAGPLETGPGYDAAVHSVFLGFVMGMILGHAPIILPAVLTVRLNWSSWFWLPAVLLEVSLVLRLGIGDGLGRPGAVRLGGIINVIALLALVAVVVCHVRRRTGGVRRSNA